MSLLSPGKVSVPRHRRVKVAVFHPFGALASLPTWLFDFFQATFADDTVPLECSDVRRFYSSMGSKCCVHGQLFSLQERSSRVFAGMPFEVRNWSTALRTEADKLTNLLVELLVGHAILSFNKVFFNNFSFFLRLSLGILGRLVPHTDLPLGGTVLGDAVHRLLHTRMVNRLLRQCSALLVGCSVVLKRGFLGHKFKFY